MQVPRGCGVGDVEPEMWNVEKGTKSRGHEMRSRGHKAGDMECGAGDTEQETWNVEQGMLSRRIVYSIYYNSTLTLPDIRGERGEG